MVALEICTIVFTVLRRVIANESKVREVQLVGFGDEVRVGIQSLLERHSITGEAQPADQG